MIFSNMYRLCLLSSNRYIAYKKPFVSMFFYLLHTSSRRSESMLEGDEIVHDRIEIELGHGNGENEEDVVIGQANCLRSKPGPK